MCDMSQKGQKRYEIFLQTGLELFFKNGYDGTNLNDIVKISGGSLASIYKFFKNKDGLFAAILEKKFELFNEELENNINLKKTEDLREFLYEFGFAYLGIFYKSDTIALSRMIISEGYKNKKLGQIFFEGIASKTIKILVDFFEKDEIKPLFKEIDCDIMPYRKKVSTQSEFLAYRFCSMIREPIFTHSLFIADRSLKPLTKKAKSDIVRLTVDIFLDGISK